MACRTTRGKSVGESLVAPLLPPETPRKPVPVAVNCKLAVRVAGALTTGRHAGKAPVSSYSSADARKTKPAPPATSNFPEGSSVAVWRERAVARLPAGLQVFVPGSYSSADARSPAVL